MIQSEAECKYDWLPFYISKAPQNFIVSNLLFFFKLEHRNSFLWAGVFVSKNRKSTKKQNKTKKLASIVLLSFKGLVFLTFFLLLFFFFCFYELPPRVFLNMGFFFFFFFLLCFFSLCGCDSGCFPAVEEECLGFLLSWLCLHLLRFTTAPLTGAEFWETPVS